MAEAASTGVVIRFNDAKGYGFIKSDEGGDDLFVHQSEIQSDGYRSLREGQKVKFSIVDKNDRQQQAVNVIALDGSKIERSRNRDASYGGRRGGAGDGYGFRNGGGYNSNGGGFRSGGVSQKECYNCGGVGHLSRDCSSPAVNVRGGGGGGCFNCGASGHLARECNRGDGGNGGGRDRECYACGEVGHIAKDCTDGSGGGGGRGGGGRSGGGGGSGGNRSGGGLCYYCRQPGHFARECPENS
ncbi:uncharacterized protein [Rutidosis leptorrhynchoides]|uniref:uncharacterized protein n=1 Tax=Rutidosis leptorrhynchoides TaxID=125765 RepID=UPI003A98DB66